MARDRERERKTDIERQRKGWYGRGGGERGRQREWERN